MKKSTRNLLIVGGGLAIASAVGLSLIPGTGDKMTMARDAIRERFRVVPKLKNGKIVDTCYNVEFVPSEEESDISSALKAVEEYYLLPMIAIWAPSTPAQGDPVGYVVNRIIDDLFPQCAMSTEGEGDGAGWNVLFLALETKVSALMNRGE